MNGELRKIWTEAVTTTALPLFMKGLRKSPQPQKECQENQLLWLRFKSNSSQMWTRRGNCYSATL